jgi:hypothetical protein
MSRDPFYQKMVDDFSNGRFDRPPKEVLEFLEYVPESEITAPERCAILAALLGGVLDRLDTLEAKASEG